ncbi:palmitoyltransferase ZDHHC23 isoform X4 [Numida meleagris]|uniref:palmitoyltransferase ZDHHC23 isoform X4 n=1 Tax=Numida meleagris TaxID=8996 RepID=UPI000B3E1FA9|nr:palmitoyltransferase ZDHHC23 isoform X4 [Numida meleagris]
MEEPLCCCEYVDRRGERNHLAACCCDCEELDEGCDRWLTCRSLPPGALERIADAVADRCRVPWFAGAVKINVSLVPPMVLLPVFLHIAALHFLLGLVVLTSLPAVVLWYYYLTHRRKERTLFFLSLGLFSLGYMYYVFLQEVVPRGHVGYSQVALLTCGLILMLAALSRAKKDPGYLPISAGDDKPSQQAFPSKNVRGSSNGLHGGAASGHSVNGETKGYSRVLAEEREGVKMDWCAKCHLVRPARAGHCRLCGRCVRRLDHHCVWINSCVGEQNHQAFILALFFFMVTSLYGIMLTLDTICRGRSPVTALFYCPGAYSDYSRGMAPSTRTSSSTPFLRGRCMGCPSHRRHQRLSQAEMVLRVPSASHRMREAESHMHKPGEREPTAFFALWETLCSSAGRRAQGFENLSFH